VDAAGSRNIFQTKEAAIHAIYQKLDKGICATCTKRIFLECQTAKPGGVLSPEA